MILDEPTNHLDVDAREALVQAINEYEGAVILISHDRHLVELTADRLWLVDGGTVQPYEGDLEDYRRVLLERRRAAGGGEARGKSNGGGGKRREDKRPGGEARTAGVAPLRKAAEKAEKTMERLNAEKTALEARLADPKIYNGAKDELAKLLKRQGELNRMLAAAEADWLAAQEKLETAAAG
jgi:ATP-binding cassette subfamily F protein 3